MSVTKKAEGREQAQQEEGETEDFKKGVKKKKKKLSNPLLLLINTNQPFTPGRLT